MPQAVAAAGAWVTSAFTTVGGAIGLSAAGAATFATFATNVLAYAATTYLINAANKALMPKRARQMSPTGGQGYEVNYYEPTADGVIIFGNVRTGGVGVIPCCNS